MTSTTQPHRTFISDDPAVPGLLWAMRFDESGRGRLVGPNEDVTQPGTFGDGFVWLHLNLNDGRLAPLIDEGRFGPKRLANTAFAADDHQRIVIEDEFVGGVVADIRHEGKPAEAVCDPAGRLHFVIGPRFLVSGRHHPIAGPDMARDQAAQGHCFGAPIQLLETLIERVVGVMAATGSRLADELDGIEDNILDGRVRDDRRRLGPIRRDAVRLHRQLLGLRAVFHRLEQDGRDKGLPAVEIATATRIAQRLDALDRDMSMLAERSRLMQDELSSELAQQSNRQLYTLSILTALFLPPTLVTGLFGMNTKSLPLSENENGSLVAIGIGILSAVIAYAVIRLVVIRRPRE